MGRHGGQELFNESLQLVCTALYEREFVFNGKYHQYDKPLTVYPRAARAIPVWVAASSADTIVAAARLGCGLIAAETIPQSAEDGPAYQGWEAAVARYMDASHASGREASMANVIVVVDLCLAPTDAQAERMFRTGDDRDFYIEKTRALRAGAPEDVIQRAEAYRKSMNRLDSPTALVGAPHAVRQKLNELISKGATRFLLRVGALGVSQRDDPLDDARVCGGGGPRALPVHEEHLINEMKRVVVIKDFLPTDLLIRAQAESKHKLTSGECCLKSHRCWPAFIVKDSFPVLVHELDPRGDLHREIHDAVLEKTDFAPLSAIMFYYWTRLSYIPWHTDGHVDAGLTISLNEAWDPNFGGYFLYRDEGEECIRAIQPARNQAVIQIGGVEHSTTAVNCDGDVRSTIQIFLQRKPRTQARLT